MEPSVVTGAMVLLYLADLMFAFTCGQLDRRNGCSLGASRTTPACRCLWGSSSALVSFLLYLLWILAAPCARCAEAANDGISVFKDLA